MGKPAKRKRKPLRRKTTARNQTKQDPIEYERGDYVTLELTPEQQAELKQWQRKTVELDKIRARIDRAMAIEAGVIPPPWTSKPKQDDTSELTKHERAAATTAEKIREPGPQEILIMEILRHEWTHVTWPLPLTSPPPDNLSKRAFVRKVQDLFAAKHGGRKVSPNTVKRTAGFLAR
jgi:hypothetical protein